MENEASFADKELLYDPLFETPPDTVIRDIRGKGFFGKAKARKTIFVLVIVLIVSVAFGFSLHSLSKDLFLYENTDDGCMLVEFNAGKTDTVLEIGPVFTPDGSGTTGETVTAVRTFALCCNEYTSIILIGKEVLDIPNTAFYSCSALMAVLVDPENPNYRSVDGVLYRLENGVPKELMLYPARSDVYRAMLALGETPPATAAQAAAFAERAAKLKEDGKEWLEAQKNDDSSGKTHGLSDAQRDALAQTLCYEILPETAKIGEMAFAECDTLFEVTIPEGVLEIATMAFFKCRNLREIRLPDSLESIGSDAFSYCAKVPSLFIPAGVTQIGHHAFYGCDAVEEVHMACTEENAPHCGQDWLPERRKVFLHDVPVVYGAERREN